MNPLSEGWGSLRRLRSVPAGAHRRVRGAVAAAGGSPPPAEVPPGRVVGRAIGRTVAEDVAASRREAVVALGELLGETAAVAAAAVTTPAGRPILPGLRVTRAVAELAALDEPARARFADLVGGRPPVFAAYLLGTLATGRGIALVETLADAVAAKRRDARWLHRHLGLLEGGPGPATFDDDDGARLRLRQFSPNMSGPASLIVLRALADPAYSLWLTTGAHADSARPPDGLPFEYRFREQQSRVHDAISRRALGPAPWPSFLGLPPWALARFMNRFTLLAGARFGWESADGSDAQRVRDLVDAALDALTAGVPVPLFLGRANERHVVLAFNLPVARGSLRLYDPARGEVLDVEVAALATGGVAGWDRLEGVLVPLPLGP